MSLRNQETLAHPWHITVSACPVFYKQLDNYFIDLEYWLTRNIHHMGYYP